MEPSRVVLAGAFVPALRRVAAPRGGPVLSILSFMTHDEAKAEAERRQQLRPEAKWLATQQGGEWTVARIGVAPTTIKQTGTATKPPAVAPREAPYSQRELLTRMLGGGG